MHEPGQAFGHGPRALVVLERQAGDLQYDEFRPAVMGMLTRGRTSSSSTIKWDHLASEQTHAHPEERLQALTADLHHRIQVAAYYLAERRGSTPGHELDNWFAAEEFIASGDAARTAED
jgi:hypothetical protein